MDAARLLMELLDYITSHGQKGQFSMVDLHAEPVTQARAFLKSAWPNLEMELNRREDECSAINEDVLRTYKPRRQR